MRLKHVVTYSLSLTRLWLKYARTQGLLAWAEVTHAHALEFVNTCYTITQDTRTITGIRQSMVQGTQKLAFSMGVGVYAGSSLRARYRVLPRDGSVRTTKL